MEPNSRPTPRFLTIEQVAEELNVKASLVRALIKSGELRAFQVGSRGIWRIGVSDVDEYISNAYRKTAERIAAGEIQEDTEPENSVE